MFTMGDVNYGSGTNPTQDRVDHHIHRVHIFVLPRRKLEIMIILTMILIAIVCMILALYNAHKEWESRNYKYSCMKSHNKYHYDAV